MIPEKWLEEFNTKMRREAIPHAERPWMALTRWCQESGGSFEMLDPSVRDAVFGWFRDRSPEGSQDIAPVFTGLFHFDSGFWPIEIWGVFDAAQPKIGDSLNRVPEPVTKEIFKDRDAAKELYAVWADCLDYAFGCSDQDWTTRDSFSKGLARGMDLQLQRSVRSLLQVPPDPTGIDSAGLTTEMALKTFLSLHCKKTKAEVTAFLHKGPKLLNEVLACRPDSEFALIKNAVKSIPKAGERYQGIQRPLPDLWNGYKTAQFAAATLIRSISNRNYREQFATRFS